MDPIDYAFDFEDPYESVVHQIKTPDEILKFKVDETLSPLDRFLHILKKGEDIQKHSALNTVPKLLASLENKDKDMVLKRLSSFIPDSGEEFNVLMAKKFPILLKERIISEQSFYKQLFPVVINGVQTKMSSISQAWNTCLLEVLAFLSKEVIEKDVLPVVRKNSDLRQTVQTRVLACKLVSKMTQYYEFSLVMRDLLPIIKHLCQDIEYEVRWNMCVSLVPIVKTFDTETTVKILLPELIELTNDEEKIVKFKALTALVDFVPFLDEDSINHSVVPAVDRYIESTSLRHDAHIVEVSRVFGGLCYHLSDYLTEDKKNYYLSFYRKLCVNGLSDSGTKTRRDSMQLIHSNNQQKPEVDMFTECRQNAAFNFPALVSFCGGSNFVAQLEKTLRSLVSDPSVLVKKTTAAGFHEVARMLSPKAVLLEPILYTMLSDENLEVKVAITKNINHTLHYMYNPSVSEVAQKTMHEKIADSLIENYEMLRESNDWRATALIIQHFSTVPSCFNDEITYRRFYPLLYRIVTSHGSRPIKVSACETLAVFIRANRKFEQRSEMIGNIVKNLSRSESSAQRIMFIELCRCFAQQFSRRFCKEHIFETLLDMSNDRVLDVRLALGKFLPMLKSMLRLPVDRNLLQKLEQSVRNLINHDYQNKQSNPSASTIRYYTQLCDQQEMLVESAMDSLHNLSKEDREDQSKEEDEKAVETQHKKPKKHHHHNPVSKVALGNSTSKTRTTGKIEHPKSSKGINLSPTSIVSPSPLSPSAKNNLHNLDKGAMSPVRKSSFTTPNGSGASSPSISNHNGVKDVRRASMPVSLTPDPNSKRHSMKTPLKK